MEQYNDNIDYVENSYEVIECEQIPSNKVNEKYQLNVEKFMCLICHTILINPVKCKMCKYHFCNVCITQWLKVKNKCPHCLGETKFEESEYYLNMDLNNLLIDCKYKKDGCNESRSLKNISEHVNKCGYIKHTCEFCNSQILSKDINDHLKMCDKNYESWKRYDYYTERITKLDNDFQKELSKITNDYKTWIKVKQFKLKQLKAFDEVQKNIINELHKINLNK